MIFSFQIRSNIADEYENPLILATGHSRGAACANLLGVLLNAYYDPSNIYVYTFATPNTVRKHIDGCNNIFNIINGSDLVTMMPLTDWGYMRAGRDIILQSDEELKTVLNDSLKKLLKLAPDINAYYSLRHSLTGAGESNDGMTTFEMMLMIANGLTSDANAVDESTVQSNAVASDSDFAELMDMLPNLSGSWTDNAILRQHMPQTYMELLNKYSAEG